MINNQYLLQFKHQQAEAHIIIQVESDRKISLANESHEKFPEVF